MNNSSIDEWDKSSLFFPESSWRDGKAVERTVLQSVGVVSSIVYISKLKS